MGKLRLRKIRRLSRAAAFYLAERSPFGSSVWMSEVCAVSLIDGMVESFPDCAALPFRARG